MTRLIRQACIVSLVGFILSGPIGFLLVRYVSPQPAWVDAQTFVEHYRVIQTLPYYFGLLLIGGMLMLVLGHYLAFKDQNRRNQIQLSLSIILVIIFCALITFNYICQTTFVHNLALHYQPVYEGVIQSFSMSNTLSIAWAIEMWGYGILGVSLWLLRDIYQSSFNWITTLLWVNMICSLISILWTNVDVKWVLSVMGVGLYLFWNILMILILSFMYHATKNNTPA